MTGDPADPWRPRWRMLMLLLVCRTALGLQFQTLGSAAQPLASDLGISFAAVGSLIGLFMFPGVVLAYPAGLANRRFSDRALVSAGLGALALGGFVVLGAGGYATVAAGRLVCGVGFVFCSLYFTKMAVDWFSGREMATAMALLVTTWPLGIAMGQVVNAWLLEHGSWRVPFGLASAFCLGASVAMAWGYRSPPTAPAAAGPAPSGPAAGLSPAARLSRREWILTTLAALAWAFINAGYVIYVSFAPKTLTALGHPAAEAAAIVSVASWVMMVSATLCGRLADRTGAHDQIIYLCTAVAAASLLILPTGVAPWAVSLALGLMGAAPAGIVMSLASQAMTAAHRAIGMGIFLTVYYLVIAPTPALAGWLLDRDPSGAASLTLGAAAFALTGAFNGAFRVLQRRLGA